MLLKYPKILFLLYFVSTSFAFSSELYKRGADYYEAGHLAKSVSCFRQDLYMNPLQAKNVLDQLGFSPPFWMIIPVEFFLILMAISLLVFSFNRWKIVFFIGSLLLSSSFLFYRHLPRVTAIESGSAKSAPHPKARVVFSIQKGDWLIKKKTVKEWTQVKRAGQELGWASNTILFFECE